MGATCRCHAPDWQGMGGTKQPCRGHILGRGGVHRMVDGGFVSYLLASSGLGFVFRPSNTHWGCQKRYFWHCCCNSLINSPVIWVLSGCLGIEAPDYLKAGSKRPPRSSIQVTSQPSSLNTVARCTANAHPLLGGAKPHCREHISGRGGADGQTHIEGVKKKNVISCTVAVIHWLPHLWFEGSVAALGLSPSAIWKLLCTSTQRSHITSLHLLTQWQGMLQSLSHLAGGISQGGEGLIGWWMAGLWAIFWRQVDWVLFSDPQTHIEGVKNAVSGAVAVIHWLTCLWFEGSVAALGLRLRSLWKLALYVHPEVSHYQLKEKDSWKILPY